MWKVYFIVFWIYSLCIQYIRSHYTTKCLKIEEGWIFPQGSVLHCILRKSKTSVQYFWSYLSCCDARSAVRHARVSIWDWSQKHRDLKGIFDVFMKPLMWPVREISEQHSLNTKQLQNWTLSHCKYTCLLHTCPPKYACTNFKVNIQRMFRVFNKKIYTSITKKKNFIVHEDTEKTF